MKLKLNNNPKISLGDNLPYIPLEFIESTGTQYIDTGFKPNQNTRMIVESARATSTTDQFAFGVRERYNKNAFLIANDDNTTNIYCNFATTNTVITRTGDLLKHKYEINKNNFYIDDILISTQTFANFSTNFNITLIKYTNAGTIYDRNEKCKLYGCKIYDNGTIVRDLIPCEDDFGVVCMYDTVSETFFYNNGTGYFIAGPELPYTGVSDRFKLKCTDLFVKDCPNVNNVRLLKAILGTSGNTLSRVRINVNNAVLTLSQAQQLLTMNGFNDNMQEQTKPRIVGSITINDYIAQEFLTQLQNTFDGCDITAPNVIDWNELAVQTLDSTKPNYNPAVAIVLNNNSKGSVTSSSMVEGGGRYFLTKTQAAAITSIGTWFENISYINDTFDIVGNGSSETYDLTTFDEFQLFTGITQLEAGVGATSVSNGPFSCPLLTSITLPDSLITLKLNAYSYSGAFSTASSLVSIDLKNVILKPGTFRACTGLQEVTLNENEVSIPKYSFNGCTNLATLNNFENNGNIVSINDSAFSNCKKLNISSLPLSLTSIGNNSFENTDGTGNLDINCPNLTSIGSRAFDRCTFLKSITDIENVTSIGTYAFNSCSNLVTVNLQGVSTIQSSAFSNCNKINRISFPNTITSIGVSAFLNVGTLAVDITYFDLNLPNLTIIGNDAFSKCLLLRNIISLGIITTLSNYAFVDCSNLITVNLPNTLISIGNSALRNCTSLISIIIPDSVNTIGSLSFGASSALNFVEIGSGVTNIDNYAFFSTGRNGLFHLKSETPCTLGTNNFNTASKLYVGDGSSAEHDNAILSLYLSDTNWSAHSSKLDTWWNYCQNNIPTISIDSNNKIDIDKGTYRPNSSIYYTLDGSAPDETSTLYTKPFDIPEAGTTIKAIEIGDTWRTAIGTYIVA